MFKAYFSLFVASVLLTGCTIPGSHLPTANKNNAWEPESGDVLSSQVNVYPLTTTLLKELKNSSEQVTTQASASLEQQLIDYEYYIGPGDVLNITIWDHPELTIPAGAYRSSSESGSWVHADGKIFYPYIGEVAVSGKTVTEIRQLISKKLKKYIESPQVDVNVAAFRSQKSYITGEINQPGQQEISNIPLTLLDAINRAGGITENADWRNVTLTRNGHEETISLYALIQRGDLTQNRLLRDGDIVHVPRNDAQKIFVMGEVNQPKMLKMDRTGMSLTEALSQVGGLNEASADATGVFVIRSTQRNNNSSILEEDAVSIADIYQLNMQDATALVIGTEFDLQPYDVVYVTTTPIGRWNRLVRQLLPTISGFNELSEAALRVKNWP